MKKFNLFHRSLRKTKSKRAQKDKNQKDWHTKVAKYKKHKAYKRSQRNHTKIEKEKWHRSSTTFNFTYKLFFDMVFYAKQLTKAFAWIFFLGMFPKWTLTQWMRGLVASNTNVKAFFAEITSMHYWNIIIAATTLFAIWKILHMKWTPPALKMTLHELSIIKRAKKKQRRQRHITHDKFLLSSAKNILHLNTAQKSSQYNTSRNIKPTKNAIHHAKNKLKNDHKERTKAHGKSMDN